MEPGEELQADQPQGPVKYGQVYAYDNGLKIAIIKAERKPAGAVFTVKIINGTGEVMDVSALMPGMVDQIRSALIPRLLAERH